MDVDAVIARAARARARRRARPHEPARGCATAKRYEDIDEILDAGDRRHLDGQHPAPREPQRRGLRADRRPRARDVPRPRSSTRPTRSCSSTSRPRRCRSGCGRQGLSAATASRRRCTNFFRLDNLAALRELVLRELAEDVEARRDHGVLDPLSQQAVAERILVLVTPGAALAADPPARVSLGPAARLRDRRALGAPARPGAHASRRPCRSPRCAGSRACSARTSSSSRATACPRRSSGSSPSAARPTSSSARPTSRGGREILRGLARLEARPRASRHRHPRRRRPGAARGGTSGDRWLVAASSTRGGARRRGRSRSRRAGRRVTGGRGGGSWCPFTGGALDPTVLAAGIRIARAEDATLVPAYLIVVPLEQPQDAPMQQQVTWRCRCSRRSSTPRSGPACRSTRASRAAGRRSTR